MILSSHLTKKGDSGMSRRTRYVLLISFAVLSSGCNSSCKSKVVNASRGLASGITRSRSSKSEAKGSTAISERRVYIDASLSMKGFVNPRNHSTFDELIDELGDALPGCRLYKYGQRGQQPPENVSDLMTSAAFGLELHDPAFYNLSYNPDDRLIDELATEDSPVRPVLSVLLTDGVYSEPQGSTSPPVIGAIQKWMGHGNTFGILMFKSAFKGPFYSERRRAVLPNVSVEQRPFYAYVFSPTTQGLNDLRDRLKRRFPDLNSIVFSSDAVNSSITIPPNTSALYTSTNPPTTAFYWQMFDSGLFGKKGSASLGYQLNYSVSPEYPIAEFNTNIVAEYYRWQQGQFKKLDSGTLEGFNSKVEAIKKEGPTAILSVAVTLPKDLSSDYSFYDFKFDTSIKELRSDIRELSTRDDSANESANKTYRFYELISALTDVHFKSSLAARTSPALFVTVANH
jgi:hypothetical protein